ncbi:MAG TPA: MBL fold metallo-hydrolase [Myxococcota bacterium]|nr:MBL fold metallo-hydrolase [Myxococcota bacterium]
MRFLRVLAIVLVVLGAVGFGAYRYLFGRTPVPETSDYVLDFAEIRRLASALPGDPPLRVNHEQVAEASLPAGAVFAGESLRVQHPMSHGAYQLVFADGYDMIDSAFDADTMHVMSPGTPFANDAWSAIQKGLAGAKQIVITHEHGDHLGGIIKFAQPEQLVGRLVLTKQQLADADQYSRMTLPDALKKKLQPIEYDPYFALAPGVVLIKAPGHTPGSQMVYVRLASGKELLFIGDVAWHMDQIRKLWYRPRLVTDFFIHENRDQVLAEFRTLHDVAEREPIQFVVSHDVDQRRELIAAGLLGEHFEF